MSSQTPRKRTFNINPPSPPPPLKHADTLTRLAEALYQRFHNGLGGQRIDLDISILLYRESLKLRLPPHLSRSYSLEDLGCALFVRSRQVFRQRGDLDEAISLHRKALALRPSPWHPDRASSLRNLGTALVSRFEKDDQVVDLDEAMPLYREALRLPCPPGGEWSIPLNNLANILFSKFTRFGASRENLDEAISLYRQALGLRRAPHPGRCDSLWSLATALAKRFEHGGRPADLDEAILLHRQSLDRRPPPHPERPNSLIFLGSALNTRYEKGGQHSDLNEAISLYRQALSLRYNLPHPKQLDCLYNLAANLTTRFEKERQRDDLNEAILLSRQALKLQLQLPPDPANQSDIYNHLANRLRLRFQQGGEVADLEEAILFFRQVLELPLPPHSCRCDTLSCLANSLAIRYRINGHQDDLDNSISLHRQVLDPQVISHSHSGQSHFEFSSNFAAALGLQFEHKGEQIYLDEAISLHRQALDRVRRIGLPPTSAHWSLCLSNLAQALLNRFKLVGQQMDLDEAILLLRKAVTLRNPHQDEPLNNLACALNLQFIELRKRGQRGDLIEAITLYRQVLDLRPSPHPDRITSLSNLAGALVSQFDQGGGPHSGLDEGIDMYKEVLKLQHPSHPAHPGILNNLAEALLARSGHHQLWRGDINEAIELCEHAIELRSRPDQYGRSYNILGKIYMHIHSVEGDEESLEKAMSSFSSADNCSAQSPSDRYDNARLWAYFAHSYQHLSATDAYNVALQILPQLASLNLDIQSRQEVLNSIQSLSDGLARAAAQWSVQCGYFDKAIELLEAGRAVIWSQVLQLRSPLDMLPPELGHKLRAIAVSLESGSHRANFVNILDNQAKMALEAEASRFRRLNEEWIKTLDEVRQIKGFEKFLQTLPFSSLQAAAAECPVVFLIPNENGSDCLVMTSAHVHHISLSNNVSIGNLANLINLIQCIALPLPRSLDEKTAEVASAPSPSAVKEVLRSWMEVRLKGKRHTPHQTTSFSSDDIFKFILNILWDEVVKPVIKYLGLQKSEDPHVRLQWCPTGLFTFLPIHAAGNYNHEGEVECASDYMISSYTPTAGALLAPVAPSPPEPGEQFKVLAVTDASLHCAQKEIEKLSARVPQSCFMQFGTPDSPALVEGVFSCLPAASIAHFACHGVQDRSSPLDSALLLKNGRLIVSKIMQQPYPKGSLAFLCACETAMGDEKLPDEAMSLGASLLFSGFRNVVATMWKMSDTDGPTIADAFYEELFRGPDGATTLQPNFSRSARALHIAVKKLRSGGVEFRRWVPFIHLGK